MSRRQSSKLYDPHKAIHTLRASDKRMAALIDQVGPCRLQISSDITPFHALLRSVIFQQLSGKAASSIYARTLDLFSRRHPTPKKVIQAGAAQLRSAGLSRAKIASVLDLADKTLNGTVPSTIKLRGMADDAVIDAFTQVRGIGRWTVEMLLIFHLGRADILPVTDLGVRKGLRSTYRLRELPTYEQVMRYGQRWQPYRSVASWYLWRANDL